MLWLFSWCVLNVENSLQNTRFEMSHQINCQSRFECYFVSSGFKKLAEALEEVNPAPLPAWA